MQDAAKDLVNAELEATGEEHVGERREEGEDGGAALTDEDLQDEDEGGGSWIWAPGERVGEKQGSVLEKESAE